MTEVVLRRATAADARLLFDWVNCPDSLSSKLLTKAPITWEEHVDWLDRRRDDPWTRIWIAEVSGEPVGQTRFQRLGGASGVWEIDVFVDPSVRRSGVARRMLEMAARRLANEPSRDPREDLRATVLIENAASQALFASLGFRSSHANSAVGTRTMSRRLGAFLDRNRRCFDASELLYARASETIPLATQTFSKSATNFVRGACPLFLERGLGPLVWDVDGNDYIDYLVGLLPVVLGYCDVDVDRAVIEQLSRGVSFSLATRLEAELAERLVRLIPSAEMVRFGKNGSDATSAAVRLARARTGRDLVAVAGYHGWHDWYIGSTTRDLGVPDTVKALTRKFAFNDPESLARLFAADRGKFAAVIMEPCGIDEPEAGFLDAVRGMCDLEGTLLIFDEIITGFRAHLGGAQAMYGVIPDIACFGKAMGNGFPISAVVGPREHMRGMEEIFFSGTFGGEALSLTAACATIDKLERLGAPELFANTGAALKRMVDQLCAERNLADIIEVRGPNWWPRMIVKGHNGLSPNLIASLLRQELIMEGLLMGANFNLCVAHCDSSVLESTETRLACALDHLADHLDSSSPAERLRGAPIQPVFQVRS